MILLTGTLQSDVQQLASGITSLLQSVLGGRGPSALMSMDTRERSKHLGTGWGTEWEPVGCEAATSRLGYVAVQVAQHGTLVVLSS